MKNIIKKQHGLFLSLLVAVSTFSGLIFSSPKVEKVSAASHPDNYDSYKYSGSYYSGIGENETGGALRASLTSLIHPNTVPSYSGSSATALATVLQYADEDPSNSSKMIYLYTRDSVTKNSASSWNREHVWPQSLSNNCWGTGKAGADLLHIRPTYNTTNSTRGNRKYGEVKNGETRTYNGIVYGYTAGGSGYFMPLDATKGDVARIIMYVWTAYYEYYGDKLPAITNVFSDFDTMMTWHINDKPDVLEGNRNDYAETSIQHNRNPFVDHPEYAWKIFGSSCSNTVLENAKKAYPSDGTSTTGDLSISNNSLSLKVGGTAKISATSSDSSNISWSVSDSTVASISKSLASSGEEITITANGVGTTKAYARATISGSVYTQYCTINVLNDEEQGGGEVIGNKITINGGTAGLGSSETVHTITQNECDIKVLGKSYSSGAKVWLTEKSGYIYNETNLGNIKKLTINYASGGSSSCVQYLSFGKANIAGHQTMSSNGVTWNSSTGGSSNTYVPDGKYGYFNISIGNKNLQASSIDIEYETSSGIDENKELDHITAAYSGGNVTLNECVDESYLVVTAYYKDESYEIIDSYELDKSAWSEVGTKTVTVSYTLNDVTKTTTFEVEVVEEESCSGKPSVIKLDEDTTLSLFNIYVDSINSNEKITGSYDIGEGDNPSKYYSNGDSVRSYPKNTLTISSTTASITSIEFTFGSGDSSNPITVEVGNFNNNKWVGNSKTVTFTFGGSSGNRRISSISVSYYDSEAFSSDFLSTITCSGTGERYFGTSNWNAMETKYNGLFSNDKKVLKDAEAFQEGNVINQAMARYDYIVSKYDGTYANFIGRNVSPTQSNYVVDNMNSYSFVIVLIVSSSLVITFVGIWFLQKNKKKESI